MHFRGLATLLVVGVHLLGGCGGEEPCLDEEPAGVPGWARVSLKQVREANRQGVPVAFENDLGMRFVLVPAGAFIMGSPPALAYPLDQDATQHKVEHTRPFFLQVTEVTNRQFRAFRPKHRSRALGDIPLDGETQPVVDVDWHDAESFAHWLAQHDGERTYRLPTEAQWEYACRGGTTTRFHWGDDETELSKYENVPDRSSPDGRLGGVVFDLDDGHVGSAPAGAYLQNPWGLHDMLGNVMEWCADLWCDDLGEEPAVDPEGPSMSRWRARVVRGGAYTASVCNVRCGKRGFFSADAKFCHLGFRLVSPLPESTSRSDGR